MSGDPFLLRKGRVEGPRKNTGVRAKLYGERSFKEGASKIPAEVALCKRIFAVKYCASACLLMMAQVPRDHICVYPDAWIGYHSAAWQGSPEPASRMIWERGRAWIAKGYKAC